MLIAGIDPGPEQSALVLIDTASGSPLCACDWRPNPEIEAILRRSATGDVQEDPEWGYLPWANLAIEWISTYSKAVGQSVFHTARWVGRFEVAWGRGNELVTTVDVRQALCRTQKAGPAQIREAILDRFGGKERAIGTKKSRGVLYRMRTGPTGGSPHMWSALGIALTLADRLEQRASTELRGSPVRGASDRPS
jgi:hypothetical protein